MDRIGSSGGGCGVRFRDANAESTGRSSLQCGRLCHSRGRRGACGIRSTLLLLAQLEKRGLSLSPDAAAVTLIRRVTYDLTGLPPTPDQVDRFLANRSPAAYEQYVDELLASPRYGERWARHWLDAAGYADSEGVLAADVIRSNAWRYRDYVIRSLNSDKPYDEFVREQLAGDEISEYYKHDGLPRFSSRVAHRDGLPAHSSRCDERRFPAQRLRGISVADTLRYRANCGFVAVGPDNSLRALSRSQIRTADSAGLLFAAGDFRRSASSGRQSAPELQTTRCGRAGS